MPVKDYLQPLIEQIVGSFPNSGIVKIKTVIDDFILNVNMLTPLGIIINELITNSMKYAFAGRDKGLITVSSSLKENHATVIIKDDGVGIPETITFGKSTGFGLDLVSLLVEQTGGSIEIVRGAGTEFVLDFYL
jgi:two-component sensor histidine kinase